MNNNTSTTPTKGKYSWVIVLLEVLIILAYLAIGFGGIFKSGMDGDIAGMFEAVKAAVYFLIIATAAVTVMCFLPAFKSKWNMVVAICNILWLIWIIYTII